jgi:COMPASS component SWD3
MNVLPAHSDPVTSVRFSPDGTTVCSGSYDGLVRLWSVATGACLRTFRAGPGDARKKTFGNKRVTPGGVADDAYGYNSAPPPPVGHVRFAPNGLFLLISTLDGCIRLADTRTGAVAKTFEGHKNKAFCVVSAFAAVPEISTTSREGDDDEPKKEKSRFETYMLSGSEDGAACAWEIQSRRLVGRAGTPDAAVAGSSPKGDAAHDDAVVGVDFSAATQTLATCGLERDKTVKLWRVRRET